MAIILIAIVLQVTAAILALKNIGKKPGIGWLFIAIPLLFMAIGKMMSLFGVPLAVNPELVPLFAGGLMLLGILFITTIFQAYRQNLNHLKSIQDIDRIMLSSLSHNGVLNAIVDKVNQTINPDAIGKYTLNRDGQKLDVLKTHNLSNKFQKHIVSDSNELVKSILENRKTLIIERIADDENVGSLSTLKQEGFTCYIGTPIISKGGVPIGALTLYSKEPRRYTKNNIDFIKTISSQVAIALDRMKFIERINEMNFESVYALVQAIEMRDPYTRGHSLQVAYLSAEIAKELGFTERELELIKFAGLLHDVGKIAVPEKILQKPSSLNNEEWRIIKLHPEQSVRIIEPITGLRQILDWVMHHHERWDGSGYPKHIKGDRIPIQSRILSICDTYSAMTEDRPYRKKLSNIIARDEIQQKAGKQLDPMISDLFLHLELNGFKKELAEEIERSGTKRIIPIKSVNLENQFSQGVLGLANGGS